MKLSPIRIAFALAAGVCLPVPVCLKAAPPPISAEEIATIMDYPGDKLHIKDNTEEVKQRGAAKGHGRVISSHLVSGEGNTFAPLSIDVTEEGALLTPKLLREVTQSIAKSNTAGRQSSLEWLALGEAGYGVTGLTILGPGGSLDRTIITLPKYGRDIQVTITVPGDPPLQVLSGAENYHHSIMSGQIRERLVECVNALASKASRQPVRASVTDTQPTGFSNAEGPSPRRDPRPPMEVRSEPQHVPHAGSPAESPAPATEQPASTAKKLWWILGGLLVFSLLFWRVMKRRQIS
jgi:hypothetical protein